jgi:hypothetical protein
MTQSSWQHCCVGGSDRSFAGIGTADLQRLTELAADADAELVARNPVGSGRYAGRLLARALCQGAALDYVDKHNGVKDFDVWSFYAQHDDLPFPCGGAGRGTSLRQSSAGVPAIRLANRVDAPNGPCPRRSRPRSVARCGTEAFVAAASRDIGHIGSAHDEAWLEVLKSQRVGALRPGRASLIWALIRLRPDRPCPLGGPQRITASRTGHLWDALSRGDDEPAFGRAAGHRDARSAERRARRVGLPAWCSRGSE